MESERRKFKRMDIGIKLTMTRVDLPNEEPVEVDLLDISRAGVGFRCEKELTSGAVYKANIRLWTGDTIPAFVNVVRVVKSEGGSIYGGIFIGMPESDWCRICVYETYQDYDENGKKKN